MGKICYIADATSIHVQRWVNYFAECGWDVSLITKQETKKETLHPLVKQFAIPVLFPPKLHKLNFPMHLYNMKKLINSIKPDIIHVIDIGNQGPYMGLIKFNPFILTGWGLMHTMKKRGLQKWLEIRALKKADVIHVESENLKNAIIKYGCDEDKIVVFPWGVDVKMFNPAINGREIREKLNLGSSPVVISVRYLERYTDVGCLINAIPTVLKVIPDSRFIIVGSGSLEHELKQLTKDLGVWDAVRFVGEIAHSNLPVYFRAADIYVSTSLLDSSSVSLLDAMAFGLPVVVTNAPSNDEWIKNEENGFIVPIKDSKSLAEKIIYLFRNPELMEKFGKRNRGIILERADQETVMKKIETLYKELININRIL